MIKKTPLPFGEAAFFLCSALSAAGAIFGHDRQLAWPFEFMGRSFQSCEVPMA
jgi:hypothetical protein